MEVRPVIKRSVKWCFLGIAAPIYLLFRLLCLVQQTDGAFATLSQLLSLAPGKLGIYLRAAFYRMTCPGTSDDISIGFLTILSHRDTTFESGVYVGPQCNIGKCFIGKNSLIGSGVHILSGNSQHNFADTEIPIKYQGGKFEKITIGQDCWIGNGSIISANVSEKSIVASGTVFIKPNNVGDIVGGNPGKVIKNRIQTMSDGDNVQI